MSSRSSVHSDSSLVYSLDMLLQLAPHHSPMRTESPMSKPMPIASLASSAASSNSSHGSSSTGLSSSSFSTQALSAVLENFPDISTADILHEQATTGFGRKRAADENGAAVYSTAGSTTAHVEQEQEEDEDDGFVYGQGAIRSDLDPLLVEELSMVLHEALADINYAESQQITDILSPVVLDSLAPSPRPGLQRPLSRPVGAYARRSEAYSKLGSNGDRRAVHPRISSTSRPALGVPTHGGAFNHRPQPYRAFAPSAYTRGNDTQHNLHGPVYRHPHWTHNKADMVTSWRKTDMKWDDTAGGYVAITA